MQFIEDIDNFFFTNLLEEEHLIKAVERIGLTTLEDRFHIQIEQ